MLFSISLLVPLLFGKGYFGLIRQQVGIRWKIWDDKTVKFWEDWWFGNCSLATQFWYLYIIADQKNVCVADVWNGSELQISFRRGVTETGMQNWHILTSIAEIHQLYRGL
jgi:hypothetical protein